MNPNAASDAKKQATKAVRLGMLDLKAVYGTVRGKRAIDFVLAKFPPDQARFKAGEDAYAAAVRDGEARVTAWISGALQAAHALEKMQA